MGTNPPFLLDPTYQGKLDSEAWRQHFCRLQFKDPAHTTATTVILAVLAVVFVVAGPVLLLLGYFQGLPVVTIGWFALVPGWIAVYPTWLILRSTRAEDAAFRAWAASLVLVEGVVTDCTAEVDSGLDAEGERYEHCHVTVSYRVVAPGGQEITGWKREQRDDLLQQPLPVVGTPVVVIALPDGSWWQLV